jgi:hypothetical protein
LHITFYLLSYEIFLIKENQNLADRTI